MSWFNFYGLAIMLFLMIPNALDALWHKDCFENHFDCKGLEVWEQIGRYGTFILMVFNLPFTYIGWFFTGGELIYKIVNGTLLGAYALIWLVMRDKNGLVKALLLSLIPSIIFIFSGIMIVSLPLIIFSLIFAVCHVTISVKNSKFFDSTPKRKGKALKALISLLLALVLLGGGSYGAVIATSALPLKKAVTMTAEEMLYYDVKKSGRIISAATMKDGKITYAAYGENAHNGTLYEYEIGSVSKTFLGLLYSKLIDEGKVSLDDSIAKYLDLDENVYYPTIGRLLTHASGYEAFYFEGSMLKSKFSHATDNDFYGTSKEQILKRVKETRLENRDYPFCYSNFGIAVLGLVLEEIYGKDYTDIINAFIKDELHLENTAATKQSGNLEGYWKWKDDDGYIPAGAVISDIHDMAEYLRICLTEEGYIAASFEAVKTADANDPAYAQLGLRIDSEGMT